MAVLHNTLRQVFPQARAGQAFIYSFCEPWGFLSALKNETGDEIRHIPPGLYYYDEATDRHMHDLPPFLQKKLSIEKGVFTDNRPPALAFE